MPTEKFFKILAKHKITLTDKNKSQSIHDFEDHNNGQIKYLDALRYIQAKEETPESWEVTKAQPKLRARGTEEKAMGTTGFTTLVFNSPVRKIYNTPAVTSPINNLNNTDVRNRTIGDFDNFKLDSIAAEEVEVASRPGNSMNVTLKGDLWNTKQKSIKFDNDEKPSDKSTNADEEDGLKYR